MPYGKLGYRIKKLRNGRAKLRVMTPLELLARLAALVPPPRHALVRFHGAFAPRSSWRRNVVPKPPAPVPKKTHDHTPKPPPPQAPPPPSQSTPHRRTSQSSPGAVLVARTEPLAPNVLSVHHWERLKSGALLATSPRVDWATLMRRTFDTDVLACPKCSGKLRILGVVDDEALASAVLAELGIAPTKRPARARDPTSLEPDQSFDEPC